MTDFLERYATQLLVSGRALSAGGGTTRRHRGWRSRRSGALLLAAAVIATPALAATHPWDTQTAQKARAAVAASDAHIRKVRAGELPAPTPPSDVPSALLKVFPVLGRYPAVGSHDNFDVGRIADSTAPNEALSRAVPAPAGAKSGTWYLTPGADGLCLSDGDGGGGCGSLAIEKIQGQFMIEAAKPPANAKVTGPADEIPLGLVSVLGIAPAGYTAITLPNTDGTSRTVTIDQNGLYDFVLQAGEARSMTLSGPAVSSVSILIP